MCIYRILPRQHPPPGYDALYIYSGTAGADGASVGNKNDGIYPVHHGGGIPYSISVSHGTEDKQEELPLREGAWLGKVGGSGSTYKAARG